MDSRKRNPRTRPTTQTIDQIEARAAEITQAERDVMNDLAEWLRAAAVELPVESKLPVTFARVANDIELFTGRNATIPALGVHDVYRAVEDWGREQLREWVANIEKVLGDAPS
jgi:hypothetical protein